MRVARHWLSTEVSRICAHAVEDFLGPGLWLCVMTDAVVLRS